ncbi:hypothetical protein FTX61_05730 [Nitriliruptoraceae bacterium ZYF776]|nr:hypothetical protein [Profundirhabdus halotolerans]
MKARVSLVALALAAGLLACDGDTSPDDGTEATTGAQDVGGLTLIPPVGWTADEAGTPAGVVAAERWADPDEPLRALQVVVGCDPGGIEDLVAGAVGSTRGSLVVTAAEERLPRPTVDGLDEVRRVSLTLGAGRDDDASSLATEALYGQAGDALVLVELTVPVTEDVRAAADDVLASVTADAAELADGCEG